MKWDGKSAFPFHKRVLSPIPLVVGSVGMGPKAGTHDMETEGIYYRRPPGEKYSDGSHQILVATKTSLLVPVETPQIQLHKYDDTEYESILNSLPALCLVNVVTKCRSSRRSDSIQNHPILKFTLLYIKIENSNAERKIFKFSNQPLALTSASSQ